MVNVSGKSTSEEVSGVEREGGVPHPALGVVAQLAQQRPVAGAPHARRAVARRRHQHAAGTTTVYS